MDKKYKILSVSSLVPLVVHYEQDGVPLSINVKVDYQNDKVHFDDLSKEESKETDFQALEQKILEYFKPPEVEIPDVYYEHLKKVHEVRSGDYATSFMKAYQVNGENNDSRKS